MDHPNFRRFSKIRNKLYIVVFGTNTKAGKAFDVVLLWAILFSIIIVMLESVQSLKGTYGEVFYILEWTFTVLFTIEYALRVFITRNPKDYIFSTFGVIDLLALLPTYISIFMTGGSYLMVIRGIRLLRIFRILKLTRYLQEAKVLGDALKGSVRKILIFMGAVITLVIITGTLMYLIEGGENGFTSIPRSIYWAVVTITTVGYGDIAPQTVLGQFFATVMMLTGYAIIAVPTGIMTSEFARVERKVRKKHKIKKTCSSCSAINPMLANYCSYCGTAFPE